MKMTSVNKANKVCVTSNDSKYTNFSSAKETSGLILSESDDDSYICIMEEEEVCETLNKSELDIEMELCEDLLNSECIESELTESLDFDKENLSELSDSDSVSTSLENYSRKKHKIEVLKSRNVEQCKKILNYEIESRIESQNDVDVIRLSKNCLQNSNKEIINDNACNEGQLLDITPDLPLSDLNNMHATISDATISNCKDQNKIPEKCSVIILKTHNIEDLQIKESNSKEITFNESEKKEVNALSVLSEAGESTFMLEFKNVEQCQNIKTAEVNETPNFENTTLLSNVTSINICNDNVLNNGQLSDNALDSTICVLEKQHSLNLDNESLRCNSEMKFPLENYESNALKNIELENQDIKNNNTVNVALNDQSLDIVTDLTLSISETPHSTNLVCNISKCNSQRKCSIQNDETGTLKDHCFENDRESKNIDPTKFTLDDTQIEDEDIKDDYELSLLAETDLSTIEEFEMSILDVTDNDEHFTTNECDEVLLSSIKVEEDKIDSNIVKVPAKSFTEQIDADKRENFSDTRGKIKQLSTDKEQYQQVKNCWKCDAIPNLPVKESNYPKEINASEKKEVDSYEANTLKNTDFESQDIKNNNTVKVALNDQHLDIVPDLTLSVLETPHSTNLVSDISKCNSQMKCFIENVETSTVKDHGFENDKKSNNIDPTKFTLDDYKEKDDDELSLLAETDVSTIDEFEISILDVADNDEHFTTNGSDEVLLSSIKVEEDRKTLSSIIVKVPEKPTITVQIKKDEIEDLLDPRWDQIKQLSTDEERYQQVKNCWKCATVPDPNKNLTYHSFRKRHFKNATVSQPKQRKRMASNNLNEHSAKRSRSCTYHLDHQIQTVSEKERQETNKIMLEMNNEISRATRSFQIEMQRQCDPYRGYNTYGLGQLQANLENKIASIRSQYSQQANHCITKVESEIHALNVARNEVLQFYKFYKGLNSRNDPTVLTLEQNLELEEIENIYSKFNQFYK